MHPSPPAILHSISPIERVYVFVFMAQDVVSKNSRHYPPCRVRYFILWGIKRQIRPPKIIAKGQPVGSRTHILLLPRQPRPYALRGLYPSSRPSSTRSSNVPTKHYSESCIVVNHRYREGLRKFILQLAAWLAMEFSLRAAPSLLKLLFLLLCSDPFGWTQGRGPIVKYRTSWFRRFLCSFSSRFSFSFVFTLPAQPHR